MSFRKVFEQKQMRDLKDWAKQVWMLPSMADKKAVAHDMIDNFEFKKRADEFRIKIDNAKSPSALDKLVGDIVLAGEGLAVKR